MECHERSLGLVEDSRHSEGWVTADEWVITTLCVCSLAHPLSTYSGPFWVSASARAQAVPQPELCGRDTDSCVTLYGGHGSVESVSLGGEARRRLSWWKDSVGQGLSVSQGSGCQSQAEARLPEVEDSGWARGGKGVQGHVSENT